MKINPLYSLGAVISAVAVVFGSWYLYTNLHHTPAGPVDTDKLTPGSYYSVGEKVVLQSAENTEKYDAAIYLKSDDLSVGVKVIKGYVTSPNVAGQSVVLNFYPEGDNCKGSNFALVQVGKAATIDFNQGSRDDRCEVFDQFQGINALKRLTN